MIGLNHMNDTLTSFMLSYVQFEFGGCAGSAVEHGVSSVQIGFKVKHKGPIIMQICLGKLASKPLLLPALPAYIAQGNKMS